jgi:hypothetical protein
VIDLTKKKQWNLLDSKEETEAFFKESFKKLIKDTLDKGIPVRTADEKGIYDLHPDGRKEYVKLFDDDYWDESKFKRSDSMLRFSDGVNIDTSGKLRIISLKDGLYVTGQGYLIPIDSNVEGEKIINKLRGS